MYSYHVHHVHETYAGRAPTTSGAPIAMVMESSNIASTGRLARLLRVGANGTILDNSRVTSLTSRGTELSCHTSM